MLKLKPHPTLCNAECELINNFTAVWAFLCTIASCVNAHVNEKRNKKKKKKKKKTHTTPPPPPKKKTEGIFELFSPQYNVYMQTRVDRYVWIYLQKSNVSVLPLRKHAYLNILRISPPKTECFETKILKLLIFLLKIAEAVLMITHNLCF